MAEDDQTTTDDAKSTDDAQDDTTTADLGEAGKKALAAEREKARKAERALRAAERARQAAEAEAEELRNASASDAEKAIAQARKEGAAEARAEAMKAANERLVKAEVKAAAAGKLANPALAVKLLDLSDFEVDDDGNVSEKAIAKAIGELLEENPYLAAGDGKPRGSGDGGARQTVSTGEDMNQQIRRLAGRA
jgi:hypothetical protein